MKGRFLFAAVAVLALTVLPAADGAAQKGKAAVQRDWTRTIARTPGGGFRMGNPDAPLKVIEYLSLTCPHCAEFAHQSGQRLFQNYVRSGRVSVEYRNYTLNGYDLAAAYLSRCAAPRDYFNMTHWLLANQSQWMGRIEALTDAQRSELRAMTPPQAMQRIVTLLGLDRVGTRHGLSAARQRACLSDQAGLNQIERLMETARGQHQVDGTPTFVINGRTITHTNEWSGIEPLLSDG